MDDLTGSHSTTCALTSQTASEKTGQSRSIPGKNLFSLERVARTWGMEALVAARDNDWSASEEEAMGLLLKPR
jgi:hypothetical protein